MHIFLVLAVNSDRIQIYGVTHSYSSRHSYALLVGAIPQFEMCVVIPTGYMNTISVYKLPLTPMLRVNVTSFYYKERVKLLAVDM